MHGRTARRVLTRSTAASAVLLGATVGMVLLSGSGQPVTARPTPRWQQLADPSLSARTDALGLRVGPRVVVLGGRGPGGVALRDGATYDLRTGVWRALRTPVALSAHDEAVAAAGAAVVRHVARAGRVTWWLLDPRADSWHRLRHVPRGASAPSAFGSEVYVRSAGRVVVYSVALDRWAPLPADPLRPRLAGARVSASRSGTVVTGHADGRLAADRWDGLRWRRVHVVPLPEPPAPPSPPGAATRPVAASVRLGGRWLVVAGSQAWLHTP